ncbi:hypothetical protein EV424DRAFT_1347418 [Suillus variegatus]|nr:hypothetical protein EV424DRAFT_1347418 [Suillus variegatus]
MRPAYGMSVYIHEFSLLWIQVLDTMLRLIVYAIKYHGDASGIDNDQAKVHYLTKILSIFVRVLANMHKEQGVLFQQKQFFRFFSSLISDLHSITAHITVDGWAEVVGYYADGCIKVDVYEIDG